MSSISAVPGNSDLSKLLTLRQASQNTLIQPSPASAPSTGSADSLTLSGAARQALQGLGPASTQTPAAQTEPTYKGHKRHHHHGGVAPIPQETPTQSGPVTKAL